MIKPRPLSVTTLEQTPCLPSTVAAHGDSEQTSPEQAFLNQTSSHTTVPVCGGPPACDALEQMASIEQTALYQLPGAEQTPAPSMLACEQKPAALQSNQSSRVWVVSVHVQPAEELKFCMVFV